MDAEIKADSLKALQAEIYRDKVLRARAMTPAERLAEALELSNDIYTWMLDGAKDENIVLHSSRKHQDRPGAGWRDLHRKKTGRSTIVAAL